MSDPDYRPHLDWIDAQSSAQRDELVRLSNLNSGSYHAEGVNAVGARLREVFAPLEADTEVLPLPPHHVVDDRGEIRERPIGQALRLRKRPDAPLRVFLGGHLDTVFDRDHPFQSATLRDDGTLHGPGVADLKGGLLVMNLALAALERSPWRDAIGWEVLLNPDEEIGSEGSAPLLAEAATRHHLGLVYEPSFPDGNLAGPRKGSGNFDLIVGGRAAHAGREHHLGRNAVRAAADLTVALDALNGTRDDVTINVGYIHGGGPTNIVPDRCVVKLNVRTARPEDEAWMRTALERVVNVVAAADGIAVRVQGGFTRPPKPNDEGIERLAGLIAECGGALGLTLAFHPTGGCCDGNNLAAAGLPNVDNLGVVGGHIHSDREFMRVDSLAERAKLSALLLMRLASGERQWH